jgi:hypothetical protein
MIILNLLIYVRLNRIFGFKDHRFKKWFFKNWNHKSILTGNLNSVTNFLKINTSEHSHNTFRIILLFEKNSVFL